MKKILILLLTATNVFAADSSSAHKLNSFEMTQRGGSCTLSGRYQVSSCGGLEKQTVDLSLVKEGSCWRGTKTVYVLAVIEDMRITSGPGRIEKDTNIVEVRRLATPAVLEVLREKELDGFMVKAGYVKQDDFYRQVAE